MRLWEEEHMVAQPARPKPRFQLGRLVATPGAIAAMQRSHDDPLTFIERHRRGDWGDVCADDARLNDEAIAHEGDADLQSRVLSSYRTSGGETLWVITEADRSSTAILLPDEY
jgi:hypothetical protein